MGVKTAIVRLDFTFSLVLSDGYFVCFLFSFAVILSSAERSDTARHMFRLPIIRGAVMGPSQSSAVRT